MARLADYQGRMLNHVEVLYQRGERELAVAFFEALGCDVVDTLAPCETGSTILYVWPDAAEHDRMNNVLYLSEVRDPQWKLEQTLADRLDHDPELAAAFAAFRHKARTAPHGTPHFGLRYPTFASLETVLDGLEHRLDPALRPRVSVCAVRPGDHDSLTDELIQAFVATDVITTGLFAAGQLIELQAQELGVD